MKDFKTIRTAIVDDNQEFIDSLKDHLSLFPEIELCGCASHYRQAGKLLSIENLNLVFLDVEMPFKNGFELLNEAREAGGEFSVIFYTAYDKYMIKALRESAFDYIIKPVRHEELTNAIERFKQRNSQPEVISVPLYQGQTGQPEIIGLPTYCGIQFMNINRVLMFRSSKSNLLERSSWECVLIDETIIKLANGISADRILSLFFKERFFQINQSCIVNLTYLNIVEYKTRQCILQPPFDKMELTISRTQLGILKERFDTF